MFNWYYWGINIGALASLVTTNIEKYHSFWLAYLVSLIVFQVSILVLIIGRRQFVRIPSHGSLLVQAWQVWCKAIRIRWTLGKQEQYLHWLDYAREVPTSSNEEDDRQNSSKNVVDVNKFIDDLKQAIRVCRVFLFYPFYHVCFNQLNNNLISQAAQMHVGKLYCSSVLSRLGNGVIYFS